jgi:signal transduction histidine kinase
MEMDFTRVNEKLKTLLFGITPSPERLAWEEPLRAELFRKIVYGCAALLVIQSVILFFERIEFRAFIWTTLEPAGFILVSIWCVRNRKTRVGTLFLLIGLSHAAAFTQMQYRGIVLLGAPLVLTILVAGLLVGAYFVRVWTIICSGIILLVLGIRGDDFSSQWETIVGWCVIYLIAAYLVELFSRYLERLLEVSRMAEEKQRNAIVAERTRFARDIHDTLAQGFTGIMMQLNAAEKGLSQASEATLNHLEKARELARQSLEEARRSVAALRTSSLAHGNLLDAIEYAGRQITADSGIVLVTKLEGTPYALSEQRETHLLRIAQEAMTNAVRHSGANRILLGLSYQAGFVELDIQDNGRGIIEGDSSGFGVKGMKERAKELNGQLSILNIQDGGTQVLVRIPNV